MFLLLMASSLALDALLCYVMQLGRQTVDPRHFLRSLVSAEHFNQALRCATTCCWRLRSQMTTMSKIGGHGQVSVSWQLRWSERRLSRGAADPLSSFDGPCRICTIFLWFSTLRNKAVECCLQKHVAEHLAYSSQAAVQQPLSFIYCNLFCTQVTFTGIPKSCFAREDIERVLKSNWTLRNNTSSTSFL